MKKTLIALAAVAVSGAAFAQATLYGVVDVGISNSAGETKFVQGGVSGGPRLGFKGSEDLGGGMSASYLIETGYKAGKEDATKIGDRGAMLTLSGGFGSVTLGSSVLSPSFFAVASTETTGASNWMAAQAAQWGASRNDNVIQYQNNFGGLTLRAATVLADDNSGDSMTDVSGVYSAGALTLAGAIRKSGAAEVNYVGASYDLGSAKLSAGKQGGDNDQTHMGVAVPMGVTTVHLQYAKNNDSGAATSVVAAVYSLSKTTTINAAYQQKNQGAANSVAFGIRKNF